jgi:hypothetical protein
MAKKEKFKHVCPSRNNWEIDCNDPEFLLCECDFAEKQNEKIKAQEKLAQEQCGDEWER